MCCEGRPRTDYGRVAPSLAANSRSPRTVTHRKAGRSAWGAARRPVPRATPSRSRESERRKASRGRQPALGCDASHAPPSSRRRLGRGAPSDVQAFDPRIETRPRHRRTNPRSPPARGRSHAQGGGRRRRGRPGRAPGSPSSHPTLPCAPQAPGVEDARRRAAARPRKLARGIHGSQPRQRQRLGPRRGGRRSLRIRAQAHSSRIVISRRPLMPRPASFGGRCGCSSMIGRGRSRAARRACQPPPGDVSVDAGCSDAMAYRH